MKNELKYSFLFLGLMLSCRVGFTNQIKIIEPIGTRIYGYAPYFSSIGSQVIDTKVIKNNIRKVGVGALLEVPTYLYRREDKIATSYFKLIDPDNDVGAAKNNTNYDLGVDLDLKYKGEINKETRVRWFIIDANEGYRFEDEDPEKGQVITAWTPEQVKIIKEIEEPYVGYYGNGINSKAAVVPLEAVGHRIGFWVLPETENGVPENGYWIKVYDLNYFFSQNIENEPSFTASTDPDEDCIKGYCGQPLKTIGAENEEGGGGTVPPPVDECLVPLFFAEPTLTVYSDKQKRIATFESFGRIIDFKVDGIKRVGSILTISYNYRSYVINNFRQGINNTVYEYGEQGTTKQKLSATSPLAGEKPKQGWNNFNLGPLPEDDANKLMEVTLRPFNGMYEYGDDVTITFKVLPPPPLPCVVTN